MSRHVASGGREATSGKRGGVRIYCTRASDPGPAALDLLTDDDLQRLAALSHPRRRTEYLAGRALIRFALEVDTGIPAKLHRISTTAGGKPVCLDGPAFSLSHCDDLVVCAVADRGSVGVDVQVPRPLYRTDEIARSCFSPEESDWLVSQPKEHFYMLWVLKEAYLKAIGRGLAGGLDALRCRISPPTIDARVADGSSAPNLAVYALGMAFLGLAALDCPCSDVTIEFVSPEGDATFRADVQTIATLGSGRLVHWA